MKFAIIADIHGNADALEAVLADMDSLNITEAVNLGDHLSGPLDAARTADILISRNFQSIKGNHDRWLCDLSGSEMGLSDKTAFEQLEQRHLNWLSGMPGTLWFDEDVFACHGTPDSDTTYWLEQVEPSGAVSSANLRDIEQHASGISAGLILCGHTHIPRMVRLQDGRVIINPGSVGLPGYDDDTPTFHQMETGNPNAAYAVAERTKAGWLVTFRSVPYDSRAMVALAQSRNRGEWARALETGWIS